MHVLSAGLLGLAVLTAPDANLADCGHAADVYAAAADKVIAALRRYERCVAAKDRRDCAEDMQALDNAHDNFADAATDLQDCR